MACPLVEDISRHHQDAKAVPGAKQLLTTLGGKDNMGLSRNHTACGI